MGSNFRVLETHKDATSGPWNAELGGVYDSEGNPLLVQGYDDCDPEFRRDADARHAAMWSPDRTEQAVYLLALAYLIIEDRLPGCAWVEKMHEFLANAEKHGKQQT